VTQVALISIGYHLNGLAKVILIVANEIASALKCIIHIPPAVNKLQSNSAKQEKHINIDWWM
jgi:hypothetical protein